MNPLDGRRCVEGVGDPLGIGRPDRGRRPGAEGTVVVFLADLLNGFRLEVDPEEAHGIVGKRDFLAVGRPDERIIKAGPVEFVPLGLALAVLAAHIELVLPGFIGDIGNGFAVRRPDGRPLVGARGVGEVAEVAFLGRDGDDLAAKLKNGAGAGG